MVERRPLRSGIILLARHASTRLPGKALASIGRRSILEHCLRRLLAAEAGPVVLATTSRPEDDLLATVAVGLGVAVYRGSARNVLRRMTAAAAAHGFDLVVRATGDNPAVDVGSPGRTLRHLIRTGADYACERGLPVGGAVEAMTFDALVRSDREATDDADREHVTTFIKRHAERFHAAWADAPPELRRPGLRVTVDTPDDLARVKHLFALTGLEEPSLSELIGAAGTVAAEVA